MIRFSPEMAGKGWGVFEGKNQTELNDKVGKGLRSKN
jgi:hypothetical protein